MNLLLRIHWLLLFALLLDVRETTGAERQMEHLGRGVVALRQASGVFVSWRLLATDPDQVAFHVYRSMSNQAAVKLSQQPITAVTHFVDTTANANESLTYQIRGVIDGIEEPTGSSFTLPANSPARPFLTIPLKTPDGYSPNDVSVGDLDGDGEYEIVLHQVGRGRDNSQSGITTEPILEAYKLDGTFLWRIHLGKNIREGAHYTQFMVYDLDGDGRAEIACKTADGTIDGKGTVIGDPFCTPECGN